MAPSLSIALPSIHRITKHKDNTNKLITKTQQQQHSNSQYTTKRYHVRTTSVPSTLPSFHAAQNQKLSMDILLDAIDLDQQMRQFFRSEVMKSKNRNSTFNPSQNMMARRRSKSAPGAPPSYHQQRALTTKWMTFGKGDVTNANQAEQVAKLIVQQHIEAVKKR